MDSSYSEMVNTGWILMGIKLSFLISDGWTWGLHGVESQVQWVDGKSRQWTESHIVWGFSSTRENGYVLVQFFASNVVNESNSSCNDSKIWIPIPSNTILLENLQEKIFET